ncbi:helix-turn-helix transcriptional regulator [Streptomyces roseoverticillatus]|uniref:helix-turn-helix transcriptional regulator n=1 Tax=Streptomyces roseoverticillatus TaxID=66429 RepID=UPI0033D0F69B
MSQHPLAVLRKSLGLSQSQYARLVDKAHSAMGFGYLVSHRVKMSRWESGRTTPDLHAQFSIARIHHVAESEVVRLGWPQWLHLATGDAMLVNRPWTARGAIDAFNDAVTLAGSPSHSHLALTGSRVQGFAEMLQCASSTSPVKPETDGRKDVDDAAVAGFYASIRNLERVRWAVSPQALYPAALGNLTTITAFLTENGYRDETGVRLLRLASRTGILCGVLSLSLDCNIQAERFSLAAIRAAIVIGSPELALYNLVILAYSHLAAGAARDVFPLLESVQDGIRWRHSSRIVVAMYLLSALAHAELGESAASSRDLERASKSLAVLQDSQNCPAVDRSCKIDEKWILAASEVSRIRLGQSQPALERLALLLSDTGAAATQFFPAATHELLEVVDTQLKIGKIQSAAHTVQWALAPFGKPPAEIKRKYRKKLEPYHSHPAVKEILDLWDSEGSAV